MQNFLLSVRRSSPRKLIATRWLALARGFFCGKQTRDMLVGDFGYNLSTS
jgi:hypothetical protein